jgi:hypothetical protein
MFSNNLHNLNLNRNTHSKHFKTIQHSSLMHQFLHIIDIIEHNQTNQIIQNIYFIIWSVQFYKQYIYLNQSITYKNIYFLNE